jgi:hypothetical protein
MTRRRAGTQPDFAVIPVGISNLEPENRADHL